MSARHRPTYKLHAKPKLHFQREPDQMRASLSVMRASWLVSHSRAAWLNPWFGPVTTLCSLLKVRPWPRDLEHVSAA